MQNKNYKPFSDNSQFMLEKQKNAKSYTMPAQ